MRYAFNVFTGTLDVLPDATAAASSGAPAVPVEVAPDAVFTAPADYATYVPHQMKVKGVFFVRGLVKVGG